MGGAAEAVDISSIALDDAGKPSKMASTPVNFFTFCTTEKFIIVKDGLGFELV